MLNRKQLKTFFNLVKVKQQPYEDYLTAAMQEKINWLKKYSTYNLNDRQKQSIAKDTDLIKAVDSYVGVQHEIISHLFGKLEESAGEIEMLKLDAGVMLGEKLAAEKALQDYIRQQHDREIHPAA